MKISVDAPPAARPAPRPRRFEELTIREKAGYLWDYYRLRILLGCFAVMVITGTICHSLHQKQPLLYVGAVNVVLDDPLKAIYSDGYIEATEPAEKSRKEIRFYTGLYLTDDTSSEAFTYSYASRIKILSAIEDHTLDLVLLDQEAFDAFSQSGYLYDLSGLEEELSGLPLTANIELIEKEEEGSGTSYTPLSYPMGIDLSSLPPFDTYSGTVYAGILKNTERLPEAVRFLRYLFGITGQTAPVTFS